MGLEGRWDCGLLLCCKSVVDMVGDDPSAQAVEDCTAVDSDSLSEGDDPPCYWNISY